MDFLYELYSKDYFALILFAVIAVLVILFVVVLIAALKDAKKTKEKEINKEDITETEEKMSFPVEENKKEEDKALAFFEQEEEKEDIKLEETNTQNSMSSLSDLFDESRVFDDEPTKEEIKVEEEPVDELESIIEKVEKENSTSEPSDDFFDLTQIDDIKSLNDEEDKALAFFEQEEPKEEEEIKEEVKEEKAPFKPSPDQYSSVFVNPKTKLNIKQDDDLELPAMKVVASTPIKTQEKPIFDDVDVPEVKISDLKAEDINLEQTGILDFTNIESETYEIKK